MAAMFSTVPDFGVARHLPGMECPAEARPPEEIERRLVVLHRGRSHQRRQHDPGLAAIDHGVIVVAEVRASAARSQGRGIRVRGACPDVGGPPIGSARPRAIGSPGFPDPIVAVGGALGQISAGLLRYRDWQVRRPGLPTRVIVAIGFLVEEPGEVGLDGKPWLERVNRGIGIDIGRVDGPTPSPRPNRLRHIAR
jgi:hypothetical protein